MQVRVKLGDICTVVSGSTPKSNVPDYWDGDIIWITPAELTNSSYIIYDSVRHITQKAVRETNLKPFPAGAVILSSRAPIGKTAIAGSEMYCNQGFKNLICSSQIYNKYLYFFLSCKTEYLNSLGRGATFKEISKAIVEEIEIPLPDMSKQREIADEFERIQKIEQDYHRQLSFFDQLVKSRFVEMFGNYVYEKKLWQVCKVGDVAGTIDPQPSHRTPPVSADGVPYIGIADCDYEHCIIDFNNARKVGFSVLKEHKVRYSLHDGDFIIGKIGTIGKPFFIPAIQNYTLSANTVLIQPIHQMVEPSYLFVFFQSEYMNRIIEEEKKSTSQPAFGIQKVRQIDMPLPPMQLQRRFADLYYQVDKSKLAVQQSLEKLETLKKSLMQRYFG